MASPPTEGPSPPFSQLGTPDTPSSTGLSSTPASARSTLGPDAARSSARRGKITQVACVPCRNRKSKCDGARPVCQSCQSRRHGKCVYDVTLDQRKPSSLRQRVGELEQEVGNFKDILELLRNALPDRLKPRFQSFVQNVEEGGLSDQLLDDAKRFLSKSSTPLENERPEGMVQMEDNTDTKFSLDSSMANTTDLPASNERPADPYFFNYNSTLAGQGDFGGNYGGGGDGQGDTGLAIPMSVDHAGPGTSYWKLEGVRNPDWSTSSGEQARHGHAITQPTTQEAPQPTSSRRTWHMSTGNPMRTLHLLGQVDNLHPSQGEAFDLNTHIPVYLVQPLSEDDPKPLSGMYSGVYAGYRDAKRQVLRNGGSETDVLASGMLNFRPALEPTSFHNGLPLPTWAAELFGAHRNLRPSDRVACAWMVTTLMRWQINPTRETYERVPPWLRPSPKQCFVPHAANIEYLPWPQVRDVLVDMKRADAEVTVNVLSVNWPHPDSEVLCPDQESERWVLTPEFQSHILSLENWTLPASLLQTLPELTGLAPVDNDR